MSDIVVCGGGMGGLLTGMLLAADGHDVTVLERDPAEPPDPADAWDDWERRGVNQFRLPHFLIPAFREAIDDELPAISAALSEAGAYRFNILGRASGGALSDPELDVLTARRPVVESVVAHVAAEWPGLTIRRGIGLSGLVSAPERNGIPRAKGVVTESGEKVGADVVVDCMGRRSPLADWLAAAGAQPPEREKEDSGFVYHGCHVQTRDGTPFPQGPGTVDFGSVSLLALPGDRGTAGIGLITSSGDAPLRALGKEAPWVATLALLPGGEEILDAKRISPLVSMAGIEDRWSRLVRDGKPVISGLVTAGDSWAATNPSLGRGISLGLRHSMALRDTLRKCGDDPMELAIRFDEVTQEQFTPWYRSTIWHDRHQIERIRAAVANRKSAPDPLWDDFRRLMRLPMIDASTAGPILRPQLLLRSIPEALLRDPELRSRLVDVELPDEPPAGPSREELLKVISEAA